MRALDLINRRSKIQTGSRPNASLDHVSFEFRWKSNSLFQWWPCSVLDRKIKSYQRISDGLRKDASFFVPTCHTDFWPDTLTFPWFDLCWINPFAALQVSAEWQWQGWNFGLCTTDQLGMRWSRDAQTLSPHHGEFHRSPTSTLKVRVERFILSMDKTACSSRVNILKHLWIPILLTSDRN